MSEAEGGARGGDELIRLPESDEELLRECEAETFRSGGPGGQHVNKVETGVRLRHVPSGIVVSCREERSQHRNKMNCLRKLREEAARRRLRADVVKHNVQPRGAGRASKKSLPHTTS